MGLVPAERRTEPGRTVLVVAPDLNGKLRTRYVPADSFDGQVTPCFVDIVFAFDQDDNLIPRPAGFTGWWPDWAGGFGDLATEPEPSSRRPVGWREGQDVVFAHLRHHDGSPVRVAPRHVLSRVAAALADAAVRVRVGTEIEFFLTGGEAEPGAADAYAFSPSIADREAIEHMVSALAESDIGVSSWYAEGGPRQYEISLAPTDPLDAADAALLARYAVTEVAERHGLGASFDPKPGPGFGSGLHVHLSLYDADDTNLLEGLDGTPPRSPGRSALAGILAVLRPATALLTPLPSGYRRLVPHSAAGTSSTWAPDNRSAGVRFLDRGADSRLEVRTAASDAHPHLVVAALLAGVAEGLAAEPALPEADGGDVYAAVTPSTALPLDLPAAVTALRASEVLTRHLGAEFVAHYAATRDWAAQQPTAGPA